MAQVHLVQILRKLNHPKLPEYLELSDSLEQIGCQYQQILRETDALEGIESVTEQMLMLDQLEQRMRELRSKFWPVFYAAEKLQESLIQSLNLKRHSN